MNKLYAFLFSLLAALAVSGCSNPLTQQSDAAPASGAGTVRVNFSRGEARTITPPADLSVFDHLEYRFAKDGGAEEARTPQEDGTFVLDAGSYTLTVNAYMSAGTDKLAASGTAAFTVTAGANASVSLTLQPAASGDGTGTFKYALAYPSGTVVESLSLTRLMASEPIDLRDGAVPAEAGLSGEKTVGVGYYLFTVSLSLAKADGTRFQRRAEVVHIYRNMTAEADYTFTEEHFEGDLFVTSAADTRAGTLRDALSKAAVGAVIHVDLPAGSEIVLESRLEINKNLTIEGNSLTLTRAASWTAAPSDGGLLYISSGAVTIRRVHFKDGRAANGGAVYNGGSLTLESCIFSGNQAAGSNVSGGAVYSSEGGLTVRGCTFYNNSAAAYGGAICRMVSGSSITLSGNLFYGNTAGSDSSGHVVYGFVTSNGYNVADWPKGTGFTSGQSGFNDSNDRHSTVLTLAPLYFKVLSGIGADGIIATLPADYPAADFYGQPITAGASAGAVQAVAADGGYAVITSTNNNSGGGISVAGTSNAGGLYTGSVSLTAPVSAGGYALSRWLVDGADKGKANPLELTLTGHVTVHAEFSRMVTSNADAGAGTLRQALTDAVDWDIITMDTANQTIELASPLPQVSKNITIEGNSLILTRAASWTAADYNSQLLYISNGTAVTIRRVHFKNGRAATGGAVFNGGSLTLESCIFSGNQATGNGGAVVNGSYRNLTVQGCTFYNNSSGLRGGAIIGPGTVLSGNLFYGNTAYYSDGHVVYDCGSTGYNVADRPKGTYDEASGLNHTDDVYSNALTLAPLNFKVLSGSGAQGIITTLPADYPAVDFYGQPITAGASAGAVQAVTAGYAVFTSTNNSGGSISIAETPNADGLYTGSVSLTAAGTGGSTLSRWLVDGEDGGTANPLVLTLDGHVTVRAEFTRTVTVTSNADAGAGTLRQALTDAMDMDIITMGTANQTIELASPLPEVRKSITIEGNSLTLTRAASWTEADYNSQLLNISYITVTIRRVHFKNGRAHGGGAVRNQGNLTLESCIFSGNQATGSAGHGGAVYNIGNLTVRGCTFYNNRYSYQGGAIYRNDGTITLSGNLFYGNTAYSDSNGHVVYGDVTSTGYNVADKPKGTGYTSGQSGFDHANDSSFADMSITGDPLNSSFAPVSGLGSFIPSAQADFPAVDFYGTARTWPGAPGAVATVQ